MTLPSVYLSYLRTFSNPLCTDFYLNDFKEALKKESKDLGQAGTSETELKNLCKEGYRRATLYYLEKVRKQDNPLCIEFYLDDFKEALKKENKNLRQVGTSETELEHLRKYGHLLAALYYLDMVHKQNNSPFDVHHILNMKECLRYAHLNTLEQFYFRCTIWLLNVRWRNTASQFLQFTFGISNQRMSV